MEVKSGMSQQREMDPYISWTMLAFRIQANLVKEILNYFLCIILANTPKTSASIYSYSLHPVTWAPSMSDSSGMST